MRRPRRVVRWPVSQSKSFVVADPLQYQKHLKNYTHLQYNVTQYSLCRVCHLQQLLYLQCFLKKIRLLLLLFLLQSLLARKQHSLTGVKSKRVHKFSSLASCVIYVSSRSASCWTYKHLYSRSTIYTQASVSYNGF